MSDIAYLNSNFRYDPVTNTWYYNNFTITLLGGHGGISIKHNLFLIDELCFTDLNRIVLKEMLYWDHWLSENISEPNFDWVYYKNDIEFVPSLTGITIKFGDKKSIQIPYILTKDLETIIKNYLNNLDLKQFQTDLGSLKEKYLKDNA